MEQRYLKMQMHSNGAAKYTQNTYKCTINLPPSWIKEMNITPDDREVSLVYDEKEKRIFLTKSEKDDVSKILLKPRKNSQNSYTWSIRIRWSWVKDMNLTKEDNLLIVSFESGKKQISIQKV